MKKWAWLFVGTVTLCAAAWWGAKAAKPQTVTLQTVTLHAAAVEQTVGCSGRVEKTSQTEVYAPSDCVIGRVLAENGQKVKKGDALFEVDREKTLSVLATQDGAAAARAAMENAVPLTVTAAATGTVQSIGLSAGDTAGAGERIAVISDNAPVCVRLSVPERYISRLAVGQTVAVSGMGFAKEQYIGHIAEIADSAKQEIGTSGTKTTVEATVTFDDGVTDTSLRVGLTTRADVTVAVQQDSFTVPYDAVGEDENGREFVYIFKDGQPQKRTIKTLAELPDGFLVKEGLADGEVLVLTPQRVTARATYKAEEKAHA